MEWSVLWDQRTISKEAVLLPASLAMCGKWITEAAKEGWGFPLDLSWGIDEKFASPFHIAKKENTERSNTWPCISTFPFTLKKRGMDKINLDCLDKVALLGSWFKLPTGEYNPQMRMEVEKSSNNSPQLDLGDANWRATFPTSPSAQQCQTHSLLDGNKCPANVWTVCKWWYMPRRK